MIAMMMTMTTIMDDDVDHDDGTNLEMTRTMIP